MSVLFACLRAVMLSSGRGGQGAPACLRRPSLQAEGAGTRAGLTPVRPDSPPGSPGSDMAGMSPY